MALSRALDPLMIKRPHPSGKVESSCEDYEIAQKIKAACQTVAVRILDHIIVGGNQYFSFSGRNSL